MPRHHLVDPTCQCRSSKRSNQIAPAWMATSPTHGYIPRRMASASQRDNQAMRHAMGTLEFRKQRNRKRTSTGEYVWSDEADVTFALALIVWTSHQSYRVGTRRSVFLQQFLSNHGLTKTRKQIASRLQVLKGEWSNTQYFDLLKDPDDSEEPRTRRSSTPPSLPEEHSSMLNATYIPSTIPSSQRSQGIQPNASTSGGVTMGYSPENAPSGAFNSLSSYSESSQSQSYGCLGLDYYSSGQVPRVDPSNESCMGATRCPSDSRVITHFVNDALFPAARSYMGTGLPSSHGHPPPSSYGTLDPTNGRDVSNNYFSDPYPFSYQ